MKTIEKEFLSTLKTQTKKFSQDESFKDLEKSREIGRAHV